MRALVFRVGEPPRVETVDGFEGIQKTVGGFLGRIVLEWYGHSKGIVLFFDEDGLLKELLPNLWAAGPSYRGAPIYGTAVLVFSETNSDGEERYIDLDLEQVTDWMCLERLRLAEIRESR